MIRNLVMALFMVPVIAMADTNNNISKVPGQYRSKVVVCNLQDEIIIRVKLEKNWLVCWALEKVRLL